MSLGITLGITLENAEELSDGSVRGRCPVCALEGRDRSGNHLRIFAGGRVHCVVDPDHWREARRILGLADGRGGRREFSPAEKRAWARERADRERRLRERGRAEERAHEALPALVARWRWPEDAVWEDSPVRPDGPGSDDPRGFLTRLFPPGATVWTGENWQSGPKHGIGRFLSVGTWTGQPPDVVGPMVAPAAFRPDTLTRSRSAVVASPYVVLDFDECGRAESLAIVRWLREGLGWTLRAMVWTGGKSIHAWFDDPGPDCVGSLRATAKILGIDRTLIGAPEHPCRLPGQVHAKTGQRSALLWASVSPAFNGREAAADPP